MLSVIMSQLFPFRDFLYIYDRQDFVSALGTDDNRSAINSLHAITINVVNYESTRQVNL
jgi:hypothetical protein